LVAFLSGGRVVNKSKPLNLTVQKEKCEWPQQGRVNHTLPLLFVCLLELLEKVYFSVLGKVNHLRGDAIYSNPELICRSPTESIFVRIKPRSIWCRCILKSISKSIFIYFQLKYQFVHTAILLKMWVQPPSQYTWIVLLLSLCLLRSIR